MFIGMQTLPVVYVENNLQKTLENITITFNGNKEKEPTFKSIKSGERVFTGLYNKFDEIRAIYLKYYNDKLAIMEKQQIYKAFNTNILGAVGTILVEIIGQQKDGRLELKITENFS
ncbi:hypothetical protein [Niallia sp. NCCP-28]|uniref:hypothetical protein n=1 Tax=Niallia sp. NCCP-28 TaxID=2934712 RepID=UPI00208923B2|nr:hypothetical protein [Niallia sp. NCCP-28]GKU82614.1 hypothetical protein NCCP28_20100 [Niallia sp. NCCP-28]